MAGFIKSKNGHINDHQTLRPCLADPDVRLSPFCWLAKFALLHKGVEFETVPLRFTEKENYPDQEHGKLPILVDGDDIICDSANIVAYAEKIFPVHR